MSVRLFVGNLPYDATEDELRAHFSAVGQLSYVFIPVDRETGKKRGFAFVEFAGAEQAQEAIRQFNNQPFKGRSLAVNEARARDASAPPRPPRPPAPFRPAAMPEMPDPAAMENPRGPSRKNFGPDAKPARTRAQKFKTEGGKKAFKERLTGRIYGSEDEDDTGNEPEIDNFALGIDNDEE